MCLCCWQKSLLPDQYLVNCMLLLSSQFISLRCILMLSYHLFISFWLHSEVVFHPNALWVSSLSHVDLPLFPNTMGFICCAESFGIQYSTLQMQPSDLSCTSNWVSRYCSCCSIMPWQHEQWGKLKGSERTGSVFDTTQVGIGTTKYRHIFNVCDLNNSFD